jgi:hypothetical protein
MDLPHTDHHLHVPVLDGLGLLDRGAARRWLAARPDLRSRTARAAASLVSEYGQAARRASGHRAFLRALSAETAA